MAGETVAYPQSFVLYDVPWRDYIRLGRILAPGELRLNYDRGTLEIMTLSSLHERLKQLLRRIVETLAEELNIRYAGFGSMTCKRQKKRRGLEPDECYWIANVSAIRGKRKIDLRIDPPPDFAIEADVSSSSVNRMSIYAALRVPEVWRLKDEKLTFHQLQSDGKYAEAASSLAFPGLAASELTPFLAMDDQFDESEMVAKLRAWCASVSCPVNQPPDNLSFTAYRQPVHCSRHTPCAVESKYGTRSVPTTM